MSKLKIIETTWNKEDLITTVKRTKLIVFHFHISIMKTLISGRAEPPWCIWSASLAASLESMRSAHGRFCYLKMWINTAANGPAEKLQDPRHRKTHIKVQLDTLVSWDLWEWLVRQAWLQLDFAHWQFRSQLPSHCWGFTDTAHWACLIYKHCSASLGIHFQVITQPHRLSLKFSSTVQTSLFFFKLYCSKTMRTLMQFSCGGQHASKAHLSLIKITKWSLGKVYLYYCINFHSFLPS